jgi:heparan-alpha-glucosaminide N-acetyltransferase
MYNLETNLKILLCARFLWIMGASMAISLRSHLRRSLSRKRLFLKVLRRSFILVALGVILNSNGNMKNSIANLRLPGVLQRIGLSYFIVASLETVLMKPQGSFQVERCTVAACNVRELMLGFTAFEVSKCLTY